MGFLILVWKHIYEKENSEFKPVELALKIDLVSHPNSAEGLGKYILEQLYSYYQ